MPSRAPVSIFFLLALGTPLAAAERPGPQIEDRSYTTAAGERVLRQELVLAHPVAAVWRLFTTGDGLSSWAAPAVEVDLRVGGTIRSSFKVGAELGGPGTVTSRILQHIPGHELTVVDDLISLLTMGGLYEWIDLFPEEFLHQLERDGDDVYTTTRVEEEAADLTRVTIFSYGYGDGAGWDRVYDEAVKSNRWFLGNLAKRLDNGPLDWSATE